MIWKIVFTHLQRPLDLENCPKLQPVYSMPSVSAILEPTTNQHKRINYLLPVCDVVCSQTLTGTRNAIFILQGQLPIALDIFSGLTCCINPLHSNISIHILYTVLYTFPQCRQGEFVWQSRTSFIGDHFLHQYDIDINVTIMSGVIFWGQIKCWSYLGVKGLR